MLFHLLAYVRLDAHLRLNVMLKVHTAYDGFETIFLPTNDTHKHSPNSHLHTHTMESQMPRNDVKCNIFHFLLAHGMYNV